MATLWLQFGSLFSKSFSVRRITSVTFSFTSGLAYPFCQLIIIERIAGAWDEDLVKGSSYLYNNLQPKLIDLADTHIEFMAPWHKYIWSKVDYRSLDMMDWIEVASAWVKAKFPEEEKQFDFR